MVQMVRHLLILQVDRSGLIPGTNYGSQSIVTCGPQTSLKLRNKLKNNQSKGISNLKNKAYSFPKNK